MSDAKLKEFVEEIGKKFGGVSQARVEQDERQITTAPQQIADMRRRYGLKEPSLVERLAQRGVPHCEGLDCQKQRPENSWCATCFILAGKPRETQASALAWKLANGEGKLLALRSPPGHGKSVAGCWLLSEKPGLFVGSTMLAIAPRRDENTHDVPANVLDARMRTAGLLVIDDLGVEHSPSGFAVARLDAIVTHRWDAGKPTLLTTNLQLADFVERYGARIASRLDGDTVLGWQELGGSDLRRADR